MSQTRIELVKAVALYQDKTFKKKSKGRKFLQKKIPIPNSKQSPTKRNSKVQATKPYKKKSKKSEVRNEVLKLKSKPYKKNFQGRSWKSKNLKKKMKRLVDVSKKQ